MTSIPPRDPLRSLRAVLACVDGVRHLPALAVLLGTFAAAGLLLAMLAQAVARGQGATMVLYGVLAFLVAFYGGNAAGLMVMDDARGQPRRGIVDALATALRTAHRLLGALLLIAIAYAAGALLLALVLVVCKAPVLGPAAYTVVLPVAVVIAGLALLVLPTVVVPLAAPAVWEGADTLQCVSRLFAIARRRLLEVVLLMLVVGLLASVVGALVMFVVAVGGQVVARLSAWILGPQAPAQQLMAGLFGFGLRSLTGAGVNVGASAYAAAGVIGGGVVAVVGSVLPGLVYLRGACEVYLAHADAEDEAASGHDPARQYRRSYQAPQDLAKLATEPSPMKGIGLDDYVEAAVATIRRAARNGPVVAVGGSMGGLTLSRVGNEVPELIDRLVYDSAFCCVELRSAVDYLQTPEGRTSLILDPALAAAAVGDPAKLGAVRINWRSADPKFLAAVKAANIAEDGPEAEGELMALLNSLLPDESLTANQEDARGHKDTWGRIPRTYIRHTLDRTIPLALQNRMIREADRLTPGNRFDVRTVRTGHYPTGAAWRRIADILHDVAPR